MNNPLTKEFLISRGSCCAKGCVNCPYWPKNIKGNTCIKEEKNETKDKRP